MVGQGKKEILARETPGQERVRRVKWYADAFFPCR